MKTVSIAPAPTPCIGVFDSGVGGLSVLRALRSRLPDASFVYVGDGAHAPYGPRMSSDVVERCERIVAHLAALGATLIVVACNTASVQALAALRARWPALRFVGVEPGIKPAVAVSRSRRIAVMATEATVASARVQHLIEQHAQGAFVHLQACAGLAETIEAGALDGPALLDVLVPLCNEVRAAAVDTVVLGCTHYPFIADAIQTLLGPQVRLIDTADAVAARAASLWDVAGLASPPTTRLLNTGSTATMHRLLRACPGLLDAEVERITL